MKYWGGKYYLRNKIAPIINYYIDTYGYTAYYEPFCGVCWITYLVKCKTRHASDLCEPLINMWKHTQQGWKPDLKFCTEANWRLYRTHKDDPAYYDDPYLAYLGFTGSFGGMYYVSLGRSKVIKRLKGCDPHEHCYKSDVSNLNKVISGITDVQFQSIDYTEINPVNSIIFCDPPYKDISTNYDYFKLGKANKFNSEKFFNKCIEWANNGNLVLLSEYQAPFHCLATFYRSNRANTLRTRPKIEDKLFIVPPYKNIDFIANFTSDSNPNILISKRNDSTLF